MVHTKVVELDGSVTRVFGDGSGSSGTRSFSERYLTSPRSPGVVVLGEFGDGGRRTWRSSLTWYLAYPVSGIVAVLGVSCNWRPFDLEGEETTRPQRPVGMVLQQQEVNGGASARRRARRPGLADQSDDGVTGWRGDEAVGETERRNKVASGGSGREQAPTARTSWAATTRSMAGQGDDSRS